MANRLKKKTPPPPPPPTAPSPEELKPDKEVQVTVTEVVKDERTTKIAGAISLLFTIFLFIAFTSYLFTWQDDQDKVHQFGVQIFAVDDVHVHNLLGVLGAYVSHIFVFCGFGLASYLFCTFFFALGVNLLFGKKIFNLLRNLRYLTVGLIVLSVTFSFVYRWGSFSAGGAVGEIVNEWFIKWIGNFGTGVLLLTAFFSYVIWRFNPSFSWPNVQFNFFGWFDKKAKKVDADTAELTENETEETVEQASDIPYPLVAETNAYDLMDQAEEDEEIIPNIVSGGNKLKSNVAPLTGANLVSNPAPDATNPLTEFNITEITPPPPLTPTPELQIMNPPMASTEGEGKLFINDTAPKPPAVVPADGLVLEIRQPVIENEHVSVIMPITSPVAEHDTHSIMDIAHGGMELEIKNPIEETYTHFPLSVTPTPSQDEEEIPPFDEDDAEEEDDFDDLDELDEDLDDEEEDEPKPYRPVQDTKPAVPARQSLNTKYDTTLDLRDYRNPTLDILETHGSEKIIHDPSELEAHKNQIVSTLKNYDIAIQRIAATVGPTVTLYEIVPAPGVRISRIKNLEDDIALSLAALGIRIIAPIPGKGTIGIEVPNVKKTVVSMKSLLMSDKYINSPFSLPIAIGKKIDNENFIVDLATMPHLLMAGATGQGKSVGINTLLVSLLFKKHPSQLKFVLVDPKKVELSLYRTIEKHFLAKLPGEEESIITDTKKVVSTLNALCIEMDNRYDLLKDAGCRNIKEYNEKFTARRLNPQKGHQYLPFIVLVVDEFADLIMTAGKEVEMPIARLAQLARAIGIHLIIATQRPSVNIITGTIKANFPARIAFKVSSKIDSRTILDTGGAEQLIGKGDMLISYNGEVTRVQCAFVDTPEVERVCDFIGQQLGYPDAFLLPEYVDEKDAESNKDFNSNEKDPLFEEAAKLIVQNQVGSTSLIQRRMKLGYNRAGRLMDQLERAGIVGPNLGSKSREVLYKTDMELQDYLDNMI